MMKKLTALALTMALALSLPVTAFAAEINQGSDPKTADVTVTTSIAPTYTVTIPASTNVTFNTLSTSFGSVKLEAAQIAPGYAVKVELKASGLLKNKADASKTIAYAINGSDGAFSVGQYTTAGQETPLTIEITQAAWNAAFAGEYSDTVTFTVSYINTTAP
ncbi:MAG: hypothetical protein ACI4WZ_05350 [Eubacteriales bacterium]